MTIKNNWLWYENIHYCGNILAENILAGMHAGNKQECSYSDNTVMAVE